MHFSLQTNQRDLNVAIIGQSTFAAEVYKLLLKNGHRVVGVFTILDKGNRQDPLGNDILLISLQFNLSNYFNGLKHDNNYYTII